MEKTTNLEEIITTENFKMPEHTGGYNWSILHGDMLNIISAFKPNTFDAVITDPPYSSGGAKPSEKSRTTN